MSNHTDQLVGERFLASIGEPWDFRSDAGDNMLTGNIDSTQYDEYDQPLVLCSVSPFLHSGIKILQVAVVNRYTGSQDLLETLRMGRQATVNFMFNESGAKLRADEVISFLRGAGSKNFLTGSMSLKKF